MITKENIEAWSTKAYLKITMETAIKEGIEYTYRHPDTIVGFLSLEKANELFVNNTEQPFVSRTLFVVSNDDVLFLTDDEYYGRPLVPEDFNNHGHLNKFPFEVDDLHQRVGGVIKTVEDLLKFYYPKHRLLNSIEELVEYINSVIPPVTQYEEDIVVDVTSFVVKNIKKQKKPFNRRRYKRVENIMVNHTVNADEPITREVAKKYILLLKTQHRKWWGKKGK